MLFRSGGIAPPSANPEDLTFYRSSKAVSEVGGKIYVTNTGAYNQYGRYMVGDDVSFTIEYFVFSRPKKGADRFGMRVRDEESKITFSSENPALNIIKIFSSSLESLYWQGSNSPWLTPMHISVPTDAPTPSGYPPAFLPTSTRVYWASSQSIDTNTGRQQTYITRYIRGIFIDSSGNMVSTAKTTQDIVINGTYGRFNRSPNESMPIEVILADVGP